MGKVAYLLCLILRTTVSHILGRNFLGAFASVSLKILYKENIFKPIIFSINNIIRMPNVSRTGTTDRGTLTFTVNTLFIQIDANYNVFMLIIVYIRIVYNIK